MKKKVYYIIGKIRASQTVIAKDIEEAKIIAKMDDPSFEVVSISETGEVDTDKIIKLS